MGTLLRLAVVLFGLWLVLRIVKRYLVDRRTPPSPSNLPPPADMLRCDYCGTFVPRGEVIEAGDKRYCSRQHLEADRSRH